MDELEISKTLKPLTPKNAAAYVKQQKADMGKTAVSIYLFIAQDGLKQTGLTFQRYCEEIGMEERTVRNWIARVKATMIVNDINDIVLVDQYELSEFNTALVPQVAALEICRIAPDQAKEAWREWSAIREEPTLANRGNAASFRRIVDRKFSKAESEYYSDSQDQKGAKTAESTPPKPPVNTVNSGPWCDTCGEPCAAGGTLCKDCKKQPEVVKPLDKILPVVKPLCICGDPIEQDGALMCNDCLADAVAPDPMPETEPGWTQKELTTAVDKRQGEVVLNAAIKAIRELKTCSAENHKDDFYWIVRSTDANGNEYVQRIDQKMFDLAPIK